MSAWPPDGRVVVAHAGVFPMGRSVSTHEPQGRTRRDAVTEALGHGFACPTFTALDSRWRCVRRAVPIILRLSWLTRRHGAFCGVRAEPLRCLEIALPSVLSTPPPAESARSICRHVLRASRHTHIFTCTEPFLHALVVAALRLQCRRGMLAFSGLAAHSSRSRRAACLKSLPAPDRGSSPCRP